MPKETPIKGSGWIRLEKIPPIAYDCGWCGNGVAPDNGLCMKSGGTAAKPLIQICPFCNKPTLWDSDGLRYPSPRSGGHVNHLPKDVGALYDEARDCISVNAHTAVVHGGKKRGIPTTTTLNF